MDSSLKDIALNVIQRDRLSEFFKSADEKQSGCFYASLVNVYHYLNPGRMLPRSFETQVLQKNPNLRVPPVEIIFRIMELKDLLHLEVSKVVILPDSLMTIDNMRKFCNIPGDVPVVKLDALKEGQDAAIITSSNGISNHAFSSVDATMEWSDFQGFKGGGKGFSFIENEWRKVLFAFYLKKTAS